MVETHITGDGSAASVEIGKHAVVFEEYAGTSIPGVPGKSDDRHINEYITRDAGGESGRMLVVEPRRKAGDPINQALLSTTYDRYRSEESAFRALSPEVQERITRVQKQIEEHLSDGKWDGVNIDSSRIPEELRGDWETLSGLQEYFKQPRLRGLSKRQIFDLTDF